MTVYLVMRGAAVLSGAPTEAAAVALATDSPNTRVVARTGIRPWWRRPADWSVLS